MRARADDPADGTATETTLSAPPTSGSAEHGLERSLSLRVPGGGDASQAAALAIVAVPVVALGLADGGFSPRPWAWATVGLALALGAGLALQAPVRVARRPVLFLGVLAALFVWETASLTWTRSVALGVLELQRLLVYLAAVGGIAVVVRARNVRMLVGGVFAGTSAIVLWGTLAFLVTREQLPDVSQGAYLHRPLGYANAMAIVSVIGILLGVGLAVGAASRRVRVGSAALLVPLTSALALTGSRAGQASLLVGFGVTIALSPDRRVAVASGRLLLVPAVAFIAVSSLPVTSSEIVGPRGDALGNGVLAVIAALTFVAALLAATVGRRGGLPTLPRRLAVLGGVAFAAVVVLGAARFPGLAGDRPLYWRAALAELRESPLLGSGAGTFSQVWLERRPVDLSVRDAHSVVVEALAELGLTGALVVCVLLALPLAWAIHARAYPLMPAVAGAYSAFASHACVDWDWELPAVTIAGLACAVALGVAADSGRADREISRGARGAAVALAAGAAAVSAAGFVGASAVEDASRALAHGDAVAAARAADRAAPLQPWSVEPLLLGGQARLLLGDRAGAETRFAGAVAREPNDRRAWLALAAVSDGDAARVALLRARALDPRSIRVIDGKETP